MQIFKSAFGFMFRLLIVDTIVLVATFIENIGRGIKVQLASHTQVVKVTGINSFKDIEDQMMEFGDEMYKTHQDIKSMVKPLKEDIKNLRKEMDQVNEDFYPEDETNVVEGQFSQEHVQ